MLNRAPVVLGRKQSISTILKKDVRSLLTTLKMCEAKKRISLRIRVFPFVINGLQRWRGQKGPKFGPQHDMFLDLIGV